MPWTHQILTAATITPNYQIQVTVAYTNGSIPAPIEKTYSYSPDDPDALRRIIAQQIASFEAVDAAILPTKGTVLDLTPPPPPTPPPPSVLQQALVAHQTAKIALQQAQAVAADAKIDPAADPLVQKLDAVVTAKAAVVLAALTDADAIPVKP